MCKLLFISDFKKLKMSKSKLNAILEVMQKGNNDGMGIFSETGYLKTDDPDRIILGDDFNFLRYDGSKKIKKGDYSLGRNLAIHSRTSTNKTGAEYAHPFDTGNAFFAHNGVVDIKKNDFRLSTQNDSEYLAHLYESGIDSLKDVSGYYAFIRYDYRNKVWNIARDNDAQLFFCKILDKENFIISTKREDILEILKILKLKSEFIKPMLDYVQINVSDSGIDFIELPSKTVIRKKDKLFEKSIGTRWNNDGYDYKDSLLDDEYAFYRPKNNVSEIDHNRAYQLGLNDALDESDNFDQYELSSDLWDSYELGYLEGEKLKNRGA